mgnify:CR=1 FL=1|jgi:hypothetical protein
MKVVKIFEKLCSPAKLYVVISVLSVLAMFIQNCTNQNMYCIGMYKTYSSHNNLIYFAVKVLYIMGWTWILEKLCKKGYSSISWMLVLLPFLAMFILIGLLFISLSHNIL